MFKEIDDAVNGRWKKSKAHKTRSRLILFSFSFVLAGALWANYYVDRFVIFHSDVLFEIAMWITLILSPLVLYKFKKSSAITQQVGVRYPTAWLRNWIMLPIMSALMIWISLVSPLGWLAVAVAWSGDELHFTEARATRVEGYIRGKGCNQYATLALENSIKDVCLDGLYPPNTMKTGQYLSVGIKKAPYGFLIFTISPIKNISKLMTT